MNETLAYYNQNADAFIAGTQNADMSEQYRFFLKHITPGGKPLDLGCGSGRDSAYFSSLGFDVMAIDGSEELCKRVRENYCIEALCMRFEDIAFQSMVFIGHNQPPFQGFFIFMGNWPGQRGNWPTTFLTTLGRILSS